MRKKQFISIVLTVAMIFACGNSLAAQSSGDKTFKGDISFIAGIYLDYEQEFAGVYTLGIGTSNVISFEASLAILGSFDMVYSGNLGFNLLSEKRVVPFATIGLGMCNHGLLYINLGGGIKIGLADNVGIRVEGRRWMAEDVGITSVLGGLSFSF